MGFRLQQGKVYKTNQSNLGVVIFQPKGGNIQLYGTNVTLYDTKNGKKRLIIPSFDDLISIWDDLMMEDTINPMNCLTTFIGFTSDNPEAEVWVNTGIDETVTPTFEVE